MGDEGEKGELGGDEMGGWGVLEVLGEAVEAGLVVGVGERQELGAGVAPGSDEVKVVQVFFVCHGLEVDVDRVKAGLAHEVGEGVMGEKVVQVAG